MGVPSQESFTQRGQFIHNTSGGQTTPVYHIWTRNTQTGNPWQLQMRRLLPSEVKRLQSVAEGESILFIRYDEDLTLYLGEKMSVPFSIGQKPLLCLRGRQGSTLQGTIVMEKGSYWKESFSFWRLTPIKQRLTPAEIEQFQALMHKRGYRSSDDWKKELLFTTRSYQTENGINGIGWMCANDKPLAVDSSGELLFLNQDLPANEKDLLVACWACAGFIQSVW